MDYEDISQKLDPANMRLLIASRKLLGVKGSSSKDDVLRAFKKKILTTHPDKNPCSVLSATERTKELNNARDMVLTYIGQYLEENTPGGRNGAAFTRIAQREREAFMRREAFKAARTKH